METTLSIIIPAFEEEDRLEAGLISVLEYLKADEPQGELIVVDDGSSDRTAEVARATCARFPNVKSKVIRYEVNRGKGYAVRTGFQEAAGKIALFSDADLSTPISEAVKLVAPIRGGECDVAFGSRALDRSLIGVHQPWRREQGGRVFNFIVRTLTGLPFWDTQCGFKAFNMSKFRPLLRVMQIDRFGFDVEFLFVSQLRGLRLREIAVRWNHDERTKVNVLRDSRMMFQEVRMIKHNAKTGVYSDGSKA